MPCHFSLSLFFFSPQCVGCFQECNMLGFNKSVQGERRDTEQILLEQTIKRYSCLCGFYL